jgi:uncharacterized phage-associated protein
MTSKARDVAKQLLVVASRHSREERRAPSELLTPLKLQKLLYYVQGFHLVILDRPAFDDAILAWTHGPVVRDVYDRYRRFGSAGIETRLDSPDLPRDTVHLINQVSDAYGQFSAWRLMEMTHDTPPWKEADRNAVISHEAMRAYFSTQVE